MKLTSKGENLYSEILNRIEPETNQIFEKTFSKKQITELKQSLSTLQKALSEKVIVQI